MIRRFQTASEYFFFFVCDDAHKQRENICNVVIIIRQFQTANKYIFSFVWLDAHKQRENIWYLVIIIGFESYNDYQVFESYKDYQIPDIFSACQRHDRQKRMNIKLAANKYFFSFVWLDAHKQRENIWYLVIIIEVDSYNDYQVPDIFSACRSHARQKRKYIKLEANEYIFFFVWLDAYKHRENIWYLVIIIGFKFYNDYQVFESYMITKYPDIFSLLVSVKEDKREKISNCRQTNMFSFLSAKQA